MKAIHIDPKNKDKLESALLAVNGGSTEHTYTTLDHLQDIAHEAEIYLSTGGLLNKGQRTGSRATFVSGEILPKKYGYAANRTQVTIERRDNAKWYLMSVARTTFFSRPFYSLRAMRVNQIMANVNKMFSFHDDNPNG